MENPELKYLTLHFGLFKVRLQEHYMHNLTIAVGLAVCSIAGTITVMTDTLVPAKEKAVRIFRPARRSSRRKGETLIYEP